MHGCSGRAANACTQTHLPLGNGDVVFHQFDTLHGVDVTRGERYSLIFWCAALRLLLHLTLTQTITSLSLSLSLSLFLFHIYMSVVQVDNVHT